MPTSTLKQLKIKAYNHEMKHGIPLYIQKRNEKYGKFNKVRKIKKIEPFKSMKVPNNPHKIHFKRVIAQIKTNAARKEYDNLVSKPRSVIVNSSLTHDGPEKLKWSYKFGPDRVDIQKVYMPKQLFPVFPHCRKGQFGQTLTHEERLAKTERVYYNNNIDSLRNSLENLDLDLDLDKIEEELDYGSDPEDEMDIDYE